MDNLRKGDVLIEIITYRIWFRFMLMFLYLESELLNSELKQ